MAAVRFLEAMSSTRSWIGAHMSIVESREASVGVPALASLTVVVTRPKPHANELVRALEGHGACVLLVPTIRIDPPGDRLPLANAVHGAAQYDWVVLTSANGVSAFCGAAEEAGVVPSESVGAARVCCIGPATARAAEAAGLRVALVPDSHVAEGALAALAATGPIGKVLLPVAEGARRVLPNGLRALGATVDVVATHRAALVENVSPEARAGLERGVDLITFASPSSVHGFNRLHRGPPIAPAAVIGPVTAEAARKAGYEVPIEAETFTVEGLVEAVVDYYAIGLG